LGSTLQQQQQQQHRDCLCNFYTKLKQASGTEFRTLNFQLSATISFQDKL
jgi:hypothetical protein